MITLFAAGPFDGGSEVRLTGDPAQHARARRVETGEPVQLLDGRGKVGTGRMVALGKDHVRVFIEAVTHRERPTDLEVVIPVADRDRMLMAAEKCVELRITSWRPAICARSHSVTPRGEGEKFREKVRARMQSALEQSGGSWLPEIHPEAGLEDVLAGTPATWDRRILDSRGTSYGHRNSSNALTIAIGPEGGFEDGEMNLAVDCGWVPHSLGASILRFETAAIAAVAIARAHEFRSSIDER